MKNHGFQKGGNRAVENGAEFNKNESKKIDVEPETKEKARQVDGFEVKSITAGPMVHLKFQILDQILETFKKRKREINGDTYQEDLDKIDDIIDSIKGKLRSLFSELNNDELDKSIID